MLKHYLKIAVRNLWKNKVFSAINVFGLTIGLTCCLLMALYIQHEMSYDKFQAKGDRIVRVIMEYSMGGSVDKGNFTSTKVLPSFKRNFAEIEQGVRMSQGARIVKYGDKLFNEKKFLFADSTFFDLFSFKLLKGNPRTVLSGANKVLLTQTAATKYFGNEDPVGKIVNVGSGGIACEVTGVTEDCPANSQIKYDFLASFSSLRANQEETYYNANYTTFFLLKNEGSIATLQAKIGPFMKKEMSGELTGNDYLTYELEPFKRIHLHSPYDGFEPNNSITYIYIIGAVALLILIIACFTYINLSTARSIERAKEVGIRKVAGAFKSQIFRQFMSESLVLSLLALLLSIILATLLLPAFSNLAERQISASAMFSPFAIIFSLSIVICISLLAGSYPAFVLSAFQPVKVLKGAFKNTGSGLWLRKSLIVFQFIISVFLIVATFIIQSQLHYIQNKKLGYDRDHVVVLPIDQKMSANISLIRNELKTTAGVLNIARAVDDPTNIKGGYNMRSDAMPEETQIMVTADPVDEEFVKTVGIHILNGADFNEQDIKDIADAKDEKNIIFHYILNESAAKALGWTAEEAVGKKMFLGNHRPGIVKAVVQDFNFKSLHNPIKPLVLFPGDYSSVMLVKLSGANMQQSITSLQAKWKTLVPHRPFEYHFLDEDYNKLYSAELRVGKVLNIFATIAVLLAALGLFGLSAFAAQQRTKEIGVRKVLGATVTNLVALLSKEFVKMVCISLLFAFPIAWYAMHNWLQDFAYRINISLWIFIVAGVAVLLITLLTVSFQAVKAAIANPVKSLRTE